MEGLLRSVLKESREQPAHQHSVIEQALIRRGDPDAAGSTTTFLRMHALVRGGYTGIVRDHDIAPPGNICQWSDIQQNRYLVSGIRALSEVAKVNLSGGRATGIGRADTDVPRVGLELKNGMRFVDISAQQLELVREIHGLTNDIPWIHFTCSGTDSWLRSYMEPGSRGPGGALPSTLMHFEFPRVDPSTLSILTSSMSAKGHGDLPHALCSSGLAASLVEKGINYIFVSNGDNLGATIDPALLGYMIENRLALLSEVTERTVMDQKGAHLYRNNTDGRLGYRETAQAPLDERGRVTGNFTDVSTWGHFHTNNNWFHLPTLMEMYRGNGNGFDLPFIVARKPLHPHVPHSPSVLQYEQPLGAFLGVIDRAEAVCVPRDRFAPVKNVGHFLAVSSDAYSFGRTKNIQLAADRPHTHPPIIELDPLHFRTLAEMRARFTEPPSLRDAESLTIEGNIAIAGKLVCRGSVAIRDERSNGEEMYRFEPSVPLQDIAVTITDTGIFEVPRRRAA